MDARKGMKVAKRKLTVSVSKSLIDDPSGIYLANHTFTYGKDNDIVGVTTVYCHYSHDLSIDMCIRPLGIKGKVIRRVEIVKIRKVGESVAKMQEIKKWKIDEESKS